MPSATSFSSAAALQLMNGGTLQIDSPRPYSAVADGLLKRLGIDPGALASTACADRDFYQLAWPAAAACSSTARHSAPTGWLVGRGGAAVDAAAAPTRPLSPQARADIARIEDAKIDYLPGLTSDGKEGAAVEHQLPRFPARRRQGRSRRHPLLPGEDPRRVGRRHRRGPALDAGRSASPASRAWSSSPARRRGMGYTAARLRRRRLVYLPFPGRQRLDRAAAGAQPGPGGVARPRAPRTSSPRGSTTPAR